MKLKNIGAITVVGIALIGYVGFGITHLVSRDVKMRHSDVQLEVKSTELKQLQLDYQNLNSKLNNELQNGQTDDTTIKQLQQQKDELDRRNKELEQQVSARAAEKKRIADAASQVVNTLTGTATASADSGGAKLWVYMHESGNNPNSQASNGACGLGQALPCSKMACSLGDYSCQDAWFTNYMVNRYGTWENAKATWISRATYVNGDYRGGWW